MLSALIFAVAYCLIVLLLAWLLVALVGAIPVPAPLSGILPTVIWVGALIICVVILLQLLVGIV